MGVAELSILLSEAAERHHAYEQAAPPHEWSDWYAAYVDARQGGVSPDEAVAAAGRWMAEEKGIVAES